MDTRLATRQYRLNKCADIIHDRCESGMNVSEYCKMHDVSKNSYYYWLKKLKENVLDKCQNNFLNNKEQMGIVK